jgi:CRP/FNR family transcriptional regulator
VIFLTYRAQLKLISINYPIQLRPATQGNCKALSTDSPRTDSTFVLLSTCFSPKFNRGAITVLNQQHANFPVSERQHVLMPRTAAEAMVAVITRPHSRAPAAETSCAKCHLRARCLPSGFPRDQLVQLDELTRVKRKVMRGAALFRQGDRFESLYAIQSGSFKSIARAHDAKVTGLHLPAELLGLDAISSQVHEHDAIALEDSAVCIVPYAQLTQLMTQIPELQAHVLRALSSDITRDGGLILRLGAMTAEQRVVAFVLGLSARYRSLGYSDTRFSVRMKRNEIASYLGITVETTCRILSRLERDGFISTHNQDLEIKHLNGLRRLSGD